MAATATRAPTGYDFAGALPAEAVAGLFVSSSRRMVTDSGASIVNLMWRPSLDTSTLTSSSIVNLTVHISRPSP